MDVSRQSPGTFDVKGELQKLIESPDWETIVADQKIPLFVFANQKTGQMKALGDERYCEIALEAWNSTVNSVLREHRGMDRAQRRIALEGWNSTVNSVLREHRGMNRAQRRKARRK